MKPPPTKPWILDLTPYPPGKPIEEVEREYGVRDSVKLASNENSLGPSPKAIEAMRAAAADVHYYPDGGAFYLRRALAERLGVPDDWLMFGNGSNELIELLVRAFVFEHDEAVVAEHAFVIYRMAVQAQGGRTPTVAARDYGHDLEAMAAAITPATRVVFLANPNNPTGTVFLAEEWRRFLEAIPPRVLVVMDEAYAEYVTDAEYPDSIAAARAGRPVVVLRTFSKIYGLAGLRIGYAVASPEILDVMNRLRAPFNVNLLAQRAALAALDDSSHLERTREMNAAGMRLLSEGLSALGVGFVPSSANFLLVRVGDVDAVNEGLLRRGVIVRPVGVYGLPEHVRVTIGSAEENQRFLEALAAVLGRTSGGDVAV